MLQPPSGGCVLKLACQYLFKIFLKAAAFGRLCVETLLTNNSILDLYLQPPSGGCVLKRVWVGITPDHKKQPPSGGCVLKLVVKDNLSDLPLAAAFGRLCVETFSSA